MKVRIAAIQYQMESVSGWREFEDQVRYILAAAAEYQPEFVMLPEIFTAQLLSFIGRRDVRDAVRRLDKYTPRYIDLMQSIVREHGFHLIAGSHPTLRGDDLYNSAYLFVPNGEYFTQDKIHRTRWEKEKWDTTAGETLSVFDTQFGKIAILICYDIEFPELARAVCEAGAEILFVPSCTDDRQGFWRVRYCCHARAIENQVYVALTGTVGHLPVTGLGLNYGQAGILTPSDFAFSRDGIAAEGVPNTEQIVIADVDLADLAESRLNGTTIPVLDRRRDVYERPVVAVDARHSPEKG
ncbi:MAG: carbon-nitrogen hydrolase family protein [Burkholderiales bacterium]|nr:carbon-nitrogen hydrolase family protein [Burkholderiales bacterium]